MKYLLPALLFATLVACAQDETLSGYIDRKAIWTLQEVNDKPVSFTATIAFPKAAVVTGNAPCNRYWGQITAPLPWFSLTNLASTKRACPGLDNETAYLQALKKMETAEFFRDVLILRNPAGENLVYRKAQ